MTTLATHALDPDQLDLLALSADPWAPTKVEFARLFRACCHAEAEASDGLIDPNRVRARIRDRVGEHYNPRQLSALWSSDWLVKTDEPVRISGEGSRGNGNKSTVYRRLRSAA